ncbi:MAG TPA: PA domain-containing protein [Actinomycetota bacterium]|nr:PA domain-containing protein [Actinomycetota bacterium]
MHNVGRRRSRRVIAIGVFSAVILLLAATPQVGAQIPTAPGTPELHNLEHVFNFNPEAHDPDRSASIGSDLEFFTHTVPLRDYETGQFIDEGGNPVAEPVMASRDFAVVGSHGRGGYIFDITDPENAQFVARPTCRQPRNDVGIKKFTDPVTGETRVVLALTQQTGTPCPAEGEGVGVQVNSPGSLAGFHQANQWIGTADVADQTAQLVFVGHGCTPASYLAADVEGKIALVSQAGDVVAAGVRECPTSTFFQKMQSAERAGAIGLVQVRNDDVFAARTAITSGIPGLELKNSDGAPILEAARNGQTINVTLTERIFPEPPVIGEGSGGIGVFDITDPYAWEPMYRLKTGRGGVHNFAFHPTQDYGYASNGALPGVINQIPIVDFTDLDNPVVLEGPSTEGGVHDVEFSPDGERAYAASENNYRIYDTTDGADPVLLSRTPNVGSYAHGVFPTSDRSLMVTNNESLVIGGFLVGGTGVCPGEGLASYDITNEGQPIGPLGYYTPDVVGPAGNRPCTSHFGRFAPGTRVMSIGWYIAGTRVVDWSNPSNPVEVAAAVMPDESIPGDEEGEPPFVAQTNTWSSKFYKGPYVYAGDIGRGFDIFRWSGEGRAPWLPPEADLGIDKSAPKRANVGETFAYDLAVENGGPDDANEVVVEDELPDGVTFQSASASQGSCSESDGVVTCELGSLGSGDTATISIDVIASERPKPPKVTNTASVTGSVDDANQANNQDSATTTIVGPPAPRR